MPGNALCAVALAVRGGRCRTARALLLPLAARVTVACRAMRAAAGGAERCSSCWAMSGVRRAERRGAAFPVLAAAGSALHQTMPTVPSGARSMFLLRVACSVQCAPGRARCGWLWLCCISRASGYAGVYVVVSLASLLMAHTRLF